MIPLAYIDIVFSEVSPDDGRRYEFVEVEDPTGASIKVGEWVDRGDGYKVLRIFAPLRSEQ